jgi:peptidoglycan/LPS O-acetylase OafA/YrhL
MDRHTSVYLDAARLCAALLVVAGHTEWNFAPGLDALIQSFLEKFLITGYWKIRIFEHSVQL